MKAWKIVVEDESNKKKMAVELAINLPHNHPLKIKERVFDAAEHGVAKLNTVTGVNDLLKCPHDGQIQDVAGLVQDYEGQEPVHDSLYL